MTVPDTLVRPLFPEPLDVVGDTHTEIDTLHDLLAHLGYRQDGTHPEGRRLVFLGDLTDRGPDTPQYVVFGHYAAYPGEPHGHGRAVCVDYAVAKRHRERLEPGFHEKY
jgi:hypothetical protein